MAVQISAIGTTSLNDRARFPLRFGTGIPIISVSSLSVSQRFLLKGNSTTPTSFSTLFSSTGLPLDTVQQTCVMISSTQVGFCHALVGGMTTTLELYKILEDGTTSNETVVTFGSLPTSANQSSDIAVDSAGKWHVIYIDGATNMGTEYRTLYYTNNVGGSWKTPIEIIGASTSVSVTFEIGIQIDQDDLPFVFYEVSDAANWAIGNVNNAASFTLTGIGSQTAGSFMLQYSLGCDEDGDHWIFGRDGTGNLRVRHHTTGNAWTTHTETSITDKNFSTVYGAYLVGNFAFVFHKDNTNNSTGVSVTKLDISGTNPTYVSTDELTTHDWHDASGWGAIWKTNPLYHNYDANGTNNGVSDNGQDLDICFNFDDDTNSDYEPYWDTYATAIITTVPAIKIGSVWKELHGGQIAINSAWKDISGIKIAIGGSWKDVIL